MTHYAGLDVSVKATSICIADAHGHPVWEGSVPTDPAAIARALKRHCPDLAQAGLETGPMTPWLYHGLRAHGIETVCLDARQVHAALRLSINKTDRKDARGLARILASGFWRPVQVKSLDAHRLRGLLIARRALVEARTRLKNQIHGLLKVFGWRSGGLHGKRFAARIDAVIAEDPELSQILKPLMAAFAELSARLTEMTAAVGRIVSQNETCRRLMTIPGVGPMTALAFVATIDDPVRFARTRNVGAWLGLTPRRYQSGELDRSGRISKCGDTLLRCLLYEAANVLLIRVRRFCRLKAWGLKLAKRAGMKKARVAVARKLAVMMLAIWRDGTTFRWQAEDAAV